MTYLSNLSCIRNAKHSAPETLSPGKIMMSLKKTHSFCFSIRGHHTSYTFSPTKPEKVIREVHVCAVFFNISKFVFGILNHLLLNISHPPRVYVETRYLYMRLHLQCNHTGSAHT